MPDVLETPIEYLKGVGPQRGELLRAELGIATFGHLLQHFPFRYVDRSRFHTVRELQGEADNVQLRGVVSQVKTLGEKQARRLTARLTDGPPAASSWSGSRGSAGCNRS
jgi:ATP-dependent DNA helicase RecG